MSSQFKQGAVAYDKAGRRYVVEAVEDGMVYCLGESGAETEFAASQLIDEAAWAARAGNRADRLYGTIRQSKLYAPPAAKLNRAGAERLLAKAEKLVPGLLDYAAFVAAERAAAETGERGAELSIIKCRALFDAAPIEARAVLLAGMVGSPPDVLIGAADLGDNLMRAMLAKAGSAGSVSLEEFGSRRRR
jgi:hypothetical protein